MFTQVFALLSFLLVDVQCKVEIWNNCSQNIADSLRGVAGNLGKNETTLKHVSVCKKFTILKDLEAHPECSVKNCTGNIQNCKEQKLSFHVKNLSFTCEMDNAGVIMRLVPILPTVRALDELTVSGVWSELMITVTYRVTCFKGKGKPFMTKRTIVSKPGSLSISCSEGTESLIAKCKNAFKSTATRDKLARIAAKMLEGKVPEMLKRINVDVANINCQ